MTVQVADIASERVTPRLVLFQGNVTLFAEHISEVTERNTLANLVTFDGRICERCYFPVVAELFECCCFSGHELRSFDSYRIHENGTESTDGGHFEQLAQRARNKRGKTFNFICRHDHLCHAVTNRIINKMQEEEHLQQRWH